MTKKIIMPKVFLKEDFAGNKIFCIHGDYISDWSNGEMQHIYCHWCKSHIYNGKFYTRKEWDEYVNTVTIPIV